MADVARPSAPPPAASARGAARRLGFRFVFSYLALFIFPFPLSLIPGTAWLGAAYERFWQAMVSAVGHRVLHLRGALSLGPDGGSGDDTAHFVQLLCMVALAAVAALAWTLVDRRGGDDRRLHEALRICVRYELGSVLLHYGMIKVFKTQFLFPGLLRLEEPFGAMSPQGLLWTFMGCSTPYSVFVGAAEAVAGLLLFFRRTTLLGALLAVGVMSNVVMLNFSYDVPVKLYASHLLLMGVFLLAPDLHRLADLLVLQRPTAPASRGPLRLDRPWLRIGRLAAKTLIVGYFLFSVTQLSLQRWRKAYHPWSELLGFQSRTYEVDDFVLDGRPLPAAPPDLRRWLWIGINPRASFVALADGQELEAGYDAGKKVLTVFGGDHKQVQGALACSRPDPDHLVLSGRLANGSLIVTAHLLDGSRGFFLVRQGFHWIEERPVDR